jgi:acyl-CoA synthetase (AMP-forming)/AMP-acid ligase II
MPRVTPPSRDPRYPDFPTIVHALADAATHRGNAPALACLDRVITYAQYAQAVGTLASSFVAAGVAGDRIAYLMRNSLDMVVALYAGLASRAQIAPLNPTYTDREIEPLVRDVDPRLIVCDPEFAERARRLAQLVGGAEVIVAGPTILRSIGCWPLLQYHCPCRSRMTSARYSSPAAPPACRKAPNTGTGI